MSDLTATFAPNNRSGSQDPVPDFASDEAAEAWIAAGQPPLAGVEPSGKNGYTKADVLSAAPEE